MNYLPILAGALINMIVGSLWYSPLLFAKPWMKLVHISEKDLKSANKNMGMMYGGTFVIALIASSTLLYFVRMLHIITATDGAVLGLIVGIGFTAATTIPDYIFAGRPMKLFAINVGYQLVVLTINGALFGAWH